MAFVVDSKTKTPSAAVVCAPIIALEVAVSVMVEGCSVAKFAKTFVLFKLESCQLKSTHPFTLPA